MHPLGGGGGYRTEAWTVAVAPRARAAALVLLLMPLPAPRPVPMLSLGQAQGPSGGGGGAQKESNGMQPRAAGSVGSYRALRLIWGRARAQAAEAGHSVEGGRIGGRGGRRGGCPESAACPPVPWSLNPKFPCGQGSGGIL